MGINSEIARLQTAKSDIASAIAAKGVTVPDGTKLDGMAALVQSIESGGGFPNGTEWTQSNITAGAFNAVANANGIWVAGANSSKGLYYSTDGKTWTQSNITAGAFDAVANANGIWVAGALSSKGLYYSVSWEPST